MHVFTRIIKKLLAFHLLMMVSLMLHAQEAEHPGKNKPDSLGTEKPNDKGFKISGSITEAATRKALSGINVSVPGYSAAITDDKGNFTIKVPSYTATLQISGQGYQYKELPLKGRKTVSAALYEESFNSVFDAAVVPEGQKNKTQINYAVSSISPNGAWDRPKESADNYLQGQVSGMNVIRRSGTPGIGADLFIRGFSSLNATNQPLYVVDGVIYDSKNYGGSIIGGHLTNPLADIDIKDIDNITVIKDGASYYGTRGANGVVLITTSHAKELATKIDFAAYGGVNYQPKNIPLLNVSDYRLYLTDILRSSGQTDSQIQAQPYMSDNPANPNYYRYHNNTNWQDQVMSNSYSQNYYLKVTGGDNIAKYALSVGYLNNNGITDNTNLRRYNTRFNADLNLSPKLTANANLAFTSNEQTLKDQGVDFSTNPLLLGLIKSPFLSVNDIADNGLQSPNLAAADIFNVSNPVALIQKGQETNKNYRFFGSVKFNLILSRRLDISSLTGLSYDKNRENTFIPRLGVAADTLSNAVAYSRLGASVARYNSLLNDTWLSYKREFTGGHDLHATIGFRYNRSQTEVDNAEGYNSPTDDFISIGYGVSSLRQLGGDFGKWIWFNGYAALDYKYLNKYFLTVNLATDGSSRFGNEIPGALSINGSKYAVMPSVAAGWLVSSERFMSGVKFIEMLKLRASFGITGNDDIGNYTARQYYVPQNILGTEGLIRGNIANPELQWEKNQKTNLGVDAAFFNERLSLSIDIYHHKTSKMVTYDPVQSAVGMKYIIDNNGGMSTNGIDVSVNSRIINKALKLDAGLNIAAYRNKITALPGNSMLNTYGGATMLTQVGQPVSLFYGYKTNGIYISNAEAAAANNKTPGSDGSLRAFRGGDVRFIDQNGDHIIDDNDRTVIGNPNPDFFGSFSSRLSYKRFSLSAIFSFSVGNDIYNQPRSVIESLSQPFNQAAGIVNRWRFDGQVTNVPRASYGDPLGNSRFSDRWIEDGSYLRLRTLAINYNLPVKPKFLKYATIYATADNLFTLTHYLGYDPEMSATGSPLTQGIDTAPEPQFRSAQLGLRIGL